MLANFMAWMDKRLPLTDAWNKHLAQYPAPKNFNFWYFFGSLAMLVLAVGAIIFLSFFTTADLDFSECFFSDITFSPLF